MGDFNKYKALEVLPKGYVDALFKHKYDFRSSKEEGAFAIWIAKQVSDFRDETIREDQRGVDAWDGVNPLDYKSRKNCPPNTFYTETAAAGMPGTRTGWVFHHKLICTQMVYSEDNIITNVQYGKMHTDDLVKICDEKVNWKSSSYKDVLYEIYHRYYKGDHRGDTTLLTYGDLESCPSFIGIPVPRELYKHVEYVYQYDGIK